MVLVSVLMRSYNHEKYISEAIESVLNQSIKDLELIIVDDFSKDSSKTIIKSYVSKDKRIKAFFHEENMGMASAMNDLFSEASGKYIAYLDSDDSWVDLKIEKQLAVLKKNDSLVVWSEGEIIDQNSNLTGETFTQINLASDKKKSGEIFEDLLNANFIFLSSLIHKREFAEGILFDKKLKYLNDYKFVVALANKHNFYFIKEPLVKYRIHGKNSNMHSNKEAWHQDVVTIYGHFLHEYNKDIRKRTKAIIYFYLFWSYYYLNEKVLAKYFFLEALKNSWVLYQIFFAFTDVKNRLTFLRSLFLSN